MKKKKAKKIAIICYVCVLTVAALSIQAYAVEDVFTAANRIIRVPLSPQVRLKTRKRLLIMAKMQRTHKPL